jgi:hypothetical protein
LLITLETIFYCLNLTIIIDLLKAALLSVGLPLSPLHLPYTAPALPAPAFGCRSYLPFKGFNLSLNKGVPPPLEEGSLPNNLPLKGVTTTQPQRNFVPPYNNKLEWPTVAEDAHQDENVIAFRTRMASQDPDWTIIASEAMLKRNKSPCCTNALSAANSSLILVLVQNNHQL